MINRDIRPYNYYVFSSTIDDYGQQTLGTTTSGTIKMAIYETDKSIQDNINYLNARYIGLTNGTVDDTYLIEYGTKKLKVLYVKSKGRLKQVFLTDYE